MIKENPESLFLSPMNGLVYDIDEVDGPLYMFSHDCTGCVMLSFSEDISSVGRVYLYDNKETDFKTVNMIICPHPVLCVSVRGKITEYDTKVPLKIEGFCDINGNEMQPQSFEITVLPERNARPKKYAHNDSIAYKAALESAVLLKNDGALPLGQSETINLFGRGVSEYRSCAVGAGRINPRSCKGIVKAFKDSKRLKLNEDLTSFYATPSNALPNEKIITEAREKSEIGIIIITRGTGENIDNRPIAGEFYLSDDEENLIKTVSEIFAKTIVILNIGYPIDVSFLEKYSVNACLYTGLGGMYGAEAAVSLIEGTSNPCGHLPDTWALDYYDIPSAHNFLNFKSNEDVLQTDSPFWSTVFYGEGRYVGYRYFSSFNKKCAFPFGFGLSYTSFSKTTNCFSFDGNNIQIKISVKNIGEVSGKDVIQIYVSKPNEKAEQVKYELAAFSKTHLILPDKEEYIELTIPIKRIATYDEVFSRWQVLSGEYKFFIGGNSETLEALDSLLIKEDILIKQSKGYALCELKKEELNHQNRTDSSKWSGTFYSKDEFIREVRKTDCLTNNKSPDKKIYFNDVIDNLDLALPFVCQLTDWELCRISVCSINKWNMDAKGEAGWTYPLNNYNLPSFALADGNCGVNIAKPNIGMPASSMLAASFDTELAYEVGNVIANEAKENGIGIILGPAMNIHRNPLNGRNSEYFSEDPLLAGIIAGYQNKGFQDGGVSGCIKHIVANNCEAVRKRSNSVMSERTLREIYMRAFEYALDVTPSDTAMTGYNAINGCFCDEDFELLEGILRGDMNFDGFVMSDWNSYDTSDMIKMVKAGISFFTPGSDDDKRVTPLLDALNSGKITRAELERNASRLIYVLARRQKMRK